MKQRDGDQPLPKIQFDVLDIQTRVIRDIKSETYVPHDSTADRLIADIEERRILGIERYGTALQPHNGRDALRDAFEEALDLAMYLKQLMVERRDKGQSLRILEVAYMQALGIALHLKSMETPKR